MRLSHIFCDFKIFFYHSAFTDIYMPGEILFFREDKRVCTSSSVQKTEKTLFGFAKKTHNLIIRFVIKPDFRVFRQILVRTFKITKEFAIVIHF